MSSLATERPATRGPDSPERFFAQVGGGIPVTLLPVRLETRFADQGRTLRIRIYPDQIHVDSHEPELTDDELALAERYWQARWAAGRDAEARRAAWAQLVRTVRPARARWLVQATTPVNLDQLGQGSPELAEVSRRAGPWTRAPLARLLPAQWVALGYRAGAEVLRAWSLPVADTVAVGLAPDPDGPEAPSPPPAEHTALAIDDGMRWMVDYDAALAAGMAITVTDAELTSGRLADGLDELVVLGVEWRLAPDLAASRLTDLLDRHAVSDGFAVLGAGTPTNNTDDDRAAPGTDPRLDPAAFDPVDVDTAVLRAGERIGRALGLTGTTAFAGGPGHGPLDDGPSADMATALWAPTLGSFFEQLMRPLVPTRVTDELAAHARRYVRGRGPFASLRIGRQPYGVLPAVAGLFVGDDGFESGLARHLDALVPFWTASASTVPRLGDGDRPDADLLDVLRRTPRSSAFRLREAAGITTTSSLSGFDLTAVFQERLAQMLLALAGIDGDPELSRVTVRPDHWPVPLPLVAPGPLSETAPPEPNFVAEVHAQTSLSGGLTRLLADPAAASSLLEALLRQAAGLEYAIGSTRLVVAHELATQVLREEPRVLTLPEPELHDIEVRAPRTRDDEGSLLARVTSGVELASTTVAAVSATATLADFLATTSNDVLRQRVATQRFAAFRASLERLATVPAAELARVAADTLDCASHRLDAWVTSLATRRLERVRQEQAVGCHLGGFGYVEDLAPRSTPASLGYLHAPSLAHATTAAVLRSGYLARRGTSAGAFAVDLSSARVALALELLEGVRRGQPIGALLGYRFERGVRDRRMTLAHYLLPLRQLAPLATAQAGIDEGVAVEAIAARDVVDGILLLRRWQRDPDGLFAALPGPVPPADRADLEAELARLDAALDAVSDLLVAESVHQTVLGNAERSAAALDALDRQGPLPDVAVARTPRTGTGYHHRLLIVAQQSSPAPGWTELRDPRQAAEPRLDAWVGQVLGDPGRYRLTADVVDDDGEVLATVTARLSELGLSALAVVCACGASGPGGASELEERLALLLASRVTHPAAARLVLLDDPPATSAGALGLRDLLDLGTEVLDLLGSARPADARALGADTERPDAEVNVGELRARADASVAGLRTVTEALASLPPGSTPVTLAARLLALADAGQRAAVPSDDQQVALEGQASRAVATATSVLDALDEAEAGFDRAAAEPAAQAAHDLDRLCSVFGNAFPVAPVFTAPNGVELGAAARDRALLGGDPLAPATWLGQHALVRPAAARLAGLLRASEMLGGRVGLGSLGLTQLPHRTGDRWIGLPIADPSRPPSASTSVVAHSAATIDFAAPMAALVVDQWSEVVPSDQETTGLSFHVDAPGARPPQTILVAVPGDRSSPAWTVDALAGCVRDTMALARIRPLDLDDLDAVPRFLPAIYLPFNLERQVPSVNLAAMISRAIELENQLFLAEDG